MLRYRPVHDSLRDGASLTYIFVGLFSIATVVIGRGLVRDWIDAQRAVAVSNHAVATANTALAESNNRLAAAMERAAAGPKSKRKA